MCFRGKQSPKRPLPPAALECGLVHARRYSKRRSASAGSRLVSSDVSRGTDLRT